MSYSRIGRSPAGNFFRSPAGYRGLGGSLYLLQAIGSPITSTKIFKIDTTLKVISSGAGLVPSAPTAFASFALGGGKSNLYFLDGFSGFIYVLDPKDYSVKATYPSPFTNTGPITPRCGIGGDDTTVYVAAAWSTNGATINTFKIFSLDPKNAMAVNTSATIADANMRVPLGVSGDSTGIWIVSDQGAQPHIAIYDSTTLARTSAITAIGTTSRAPLSVEARNNKSVVIFGNPASTGPNDTPVSYYDNTFAVLKTQVIDATITTGIRSICGTF